MNPVPAFISGCYIVKDEEELLGKSLEALRPFVDEIVVYDTGSTDGTLDIAARHGVRVVRGYWDDDFGAARNRALGHCAGDWIISVDADEIPVGDARALRRYLRTTPVDVLMVVQASEDWDGSGNSVQIRAPRIFRRSHCRWQGALHEQLIGRWGGVDAENTTMMRLQHAGYTVLRRQERDKGGRNLKVAERALLDARGEGLRDLNIYLINAARSAIEAGDNQRAFELFGQVDRSGLDAALGIVAAHAAIAAAIGVERLDVAQVWLEALRAWGEFPSVCQAFEGCLALFAGEPVAAELLFRGIEDLDNLVSRAFAIGSYRDYLIDALWEQGRLEEAADMLIEHIGSGQRSMVPPVVNVVRLARVDGAVERLARRLPEALLVPYVGQLRPAAWTVGDSFYEALWQADRVRTAVLAAVSEQWLMLPFERALVWSLRSREAGLAELCPLRRILASPDCEAMRRLLSGAVLVEIGEQDALNVLEPLLDEVSDEDTPDVLARLQEVAPQFASTLLPE
ncbi:hypothetical protein FHR75_000463 [Kineococcus radiotolerans]|uniref:Glycosyltransferase 2-like domain-containing protein n=1 Tax=Kineococcus radiotolerans TaxID=131568 RepID=A0A7W4TIT4_KINRA|nr:glycosyltransferase family 2 protein [Kineococcus radiotolerans]MBB2899675.1 hypothetical protein [Kineococcus radiotolerans]